MSEGPESLTKAGVFIVVIGLFNVLVALSLPWDDYLWLISGVIVTGLGVWLILLDRRFQRERRALDKELEEIMREEG
jgi:membrane protein implicated in regulation of membrane protease activity